MARNGDKDISDELLRNGKIDDILNRMSKSKSKKQEKESEEINYDDVEFDKLDDKTRRAYTDLFQGLPDVYKIVGAKENESQESINKKCVEKLKKYQPDRHSELVKKYPDDERKRELKKLAMQYDLIRQASDILRNPKKRKYYDLQKKTVQSKNFVAQKESFEEYKKLQDSKINEHTRKLAQNDFDLHFLELDKQRGLDREKLKERPLNTDETNRRYEDLQLSRDQDLIEYVPDNAFEGRAFSSDEFNKNWAMYKKREEKKRGNKGGDRSLLKWDGIAAANDFGMSGGSDYISIDNYEDIFADDNFNDSSMFASRLDDSDNGGFSDSGSEFSDTDLNYDKFDDHDKNKEQTMMSFEERLKQREIEDKEYDNRELKDKKSWKSVFENPMNISSTMGDIIAGKDLRHLEGQKQTKTIGREYASVYKQLVYDDDENDEQKKSSKSSKHEDRHKHSKHKHSSSGTKKKKSDEEK